MFETTNQIWFVVNVSINKLTKGAHRKGIFTVHSLSDKAIEIHEARIKFNQVVSTYG